MKNINVLKLHLLAACVALIFVSGAHAQQTAPTPPQRPSARHLFDAAHAQQTAPNPPPPVTDDYATQTGFRNKILDVRHRDPVNLLPVLRSLGSGFRGATITASREFKTLAVRDFPENIVTIEEALKRLDVPETPQTGIELRIHVLVASNTTESANDFPADLRDTIGQLQSTLNFKNYRLVNSMIQRTREGASSSGSGVAEFTSPSGGSNRTSGSYNFEARDISVDSTASRIPVVQIGRFNFEANFYVPDQGGYSRANVNTAVSVRDGERVVVGTASLKDKALILVLTARVIK